MDKETRGNKADSETIFSMICQKDFSRLINRFLDRKGQGRVYPTLRNLEVTNPLSSKSIISYIYFIEHYQIS